MTYSHLWKVFEIVSKSPKTNEVVMDFKGNPTLMTAADDKMLQNDIKMFTESSI